MDSSAAFSSRPLGTSSIENAQWIPDESDKLMPCNGSHGGRNTSRDENSWPATQLTTLAAELSRAGESLDPEEVACSSPNMDVGEAVLRDITVMQKLFEDTVVRPVGTLQKQSSRLPRSAHDAREAGHDECLPFPPVRKAKPKRLHFDRLYSGASHTLRDRHMAYIRDMFAILNQQESQPSQATLPGSPSISGATRWTIQSGRLDASTRRGPDFALKYGTSPPGLLEARRESITAEVRRRRALAAPHDAPKITMVPPPPSQAVPVILPPDRAERQREEIEVLLLDADLDAADFDEPDMDAVTRSALEAAAEAGYLLRVR